MDWSPIKQRVIEDVMRKLMSLGVEYKIVTPVGEYGDLETVKPVAQRKKSALRFPRGELRNHYMPYIINLKPGDEVIIPGAKFGVDAVQSGLTSWTISNWGHGSVVTMRDKDKDTLTVLRIS